MIQMNLFTKHRLTNIENKFVITKQNRKWGINYEFCISIYILLYIK